MKLLSKVLLTICTLLMMGNLYAQAFVQSEFSGSPATTNCAACSLGEVQYQFTNTVIGGTAAAPTLSFDVQLRAATGVEAFSLFNTTVYLSYDTSAFSPAAFPPSNVGSCKTELSKTVADNPANYALAVVNNTGSIGAIGLTADGIPLAFTPAGAYITINNNYVTLFTVTCDITDANQPAGVAFHALTWNQTGQRSTAASETDPTVTPSGNSHISIAPFATAENNLLTQPLFEAPLVAEVRLSADNSSIEIVFDRAIEPVVGADIETSGTSIVGAPSLSSDAKTLTIRFPQFTNRSISIFGATDKIVSAAEGAHKNPSPYLLATLPPYTNDINFVVGSGSSSTRVIGNNIHLVLPSNIPVSSLTGGVENIANYFMTSLGGDGTNSPLAVNRAIISTQSNTIIVSVIFNADPSTGTALSFSNRKVCFGSRCLRPIQPALIFPTPTDDFTGPMVTYSHNEMSPRDSRFEAGSIIYTVDFNEAISAVETPAADIYSRTQAQKAAGGRGVLATSTTAVSAGGTAWTFTQTGALTFDSELEPEADRIVEYYLRMTRGVDLALNFVQNPSSLPVVVELGGGIIATPVGIAGSNDFWVIIDFGGTVSAFDSAKASNIALSVTNPDDGTIKGVSIVSGSAQTGLPGGADLGSSPVASALNTRNVLSFRVTPTGTLDGGESASGNEVISIVISEGTLSADGIPNNADPIEFNALENGRPEISALWPSSQVKSLELNAGTTNTYTLGTVTFSMRVTEDLGTSLSIIRNAIDVYSINEASLGSRNLALGITFPNSALTLVTGTSKTAVRVSQNLYEITFDNVQLQTAGANRFAENGLVAVIAPGFFNDNGIEDCQGTVWYPSVDPRRTIRVTACVSQDAAASPSMIPSAPVGQIANLRDGIRYVAKSALDLPFDDRMEHFGWNVRGFAHRATAFVNDDRPAYFNFIEAEKPVNILWRIEDSSGFYLLSATTASEIRQTIQFVRSASFARPFAIIPPNGLSADLTIALGNTVTESPSDLNLRIERTSYVPQYVTILGSVGYGSIPIPNTDLGVYSFTSSTNVWRIGDKFNKLLTADVAVGDIPTAEVQQAVAGEQTQITFDSYIPFVVERSTTQTTFSVEFSGIGVPTPAGCNAYPTDSSNLCTNYTVAIPRANDAATVKAVRLSGSTMSFDLTLAIPADDKAAKAWIRLSQSGSDGAVFVASVGIIDPMAAVLGAPDSSGDGIPNSIVGNDIPDNVHALPVYYRSIASSATAPTGYIRGSRGTIVATSPEVYENVLANLTAAATLGDFNANSFSNGASQFIDKLETLAMAEGGLDIRAVISFVIQKVGTSLSATGMYKGAEAGVIIPLPSLGEWHPRKLKPDAEEMMVLTALPANQYGLADSKGSVCPSDPIASEGMTSPYRGTDGKFRNGPGVEGNCMVLYITDGTIYEDIDGQRNGLVTDPVALLASSCVVDCGPVRRAGGVSGGGGTGGGGGGGAVAMTELAGVIALLVGLSAYSLIRRRKLQVVKTD